MALKDIMRLKKQLIYSAKHIREAWDEKTEDEKEDFEYDLEAAMSHIEDLIR